MILWIKDKIFLCVLLSVYIVLVFRAIPLFAEEGISKGLLSADDDTPVEITAKNQEYNKKEGLYTAEGDVIITRGGISLTSQEAVYHTETGIAEASGDIRFETGEDILTGESGVFNLTDMTGKINKGHLFL